MAKEPEAVVARYQIEAWLTEAVDPHACVQATPPMVTPDDAPLPPANCKDKTMTFVPAVKVKFPPGNPSPDVKS
jgi:hypothetical protein